MLRDYLKEFGVLAFEETFYLPLGRSTAMLLQLKGPRYRQMQDYTLEEARADF